MLLLAAGTSAAHAFYAAAGSGAGTASVDAPRAVAVTRATASADLLPGGSGALSLQLSNPNAYSVRITALELDPTQGTNGVSTDASHAACTAPALSMSRQDNGGEGWTLEPGTTLQARLAGAVNMGLDAQDACQGATFSVHVRAVAVAA